MQRATEIANLLLREGALREGDPEHQAVYEELTTNTALFQEVHRRLAAVGYDLVSYLGRLGVRIDPTALDAAEHRNRMGLHAGHIRLLVYFWVQLVYRESVALTRGQQTAAPGAEQAALFGGDDDLEPPWISYARVFADFADVMSRSRFKGLLTGLRRWRFIGHDEKRDRIWAGPPLFTLIDQRRMEECVIERARRLGTSDPAEAVSAIATGSGLSHGDGEGGTA